MVREYFHRFMELYREFTPVSETLQISKSSASVKLAKVEI